jgi:lactate permease
MILRLPATKAMAISWLAFALVAIFGWKIPLFQVGAASVEGLIIAGSVIWILFGAILLLNMLTCSGAMTSIRKWFMHISPDQRIQAIIIAWLLGSFLEGAAGFGSPAAICAPLLVALGFPPMAAVVLSLLSNSISVTFGSAGTTILVGTVQGIQQGTQPAAMVASYLNGIPFSDFIQQVSEKSALLNILPGTLMPLVLTVLLTRFWGKHKSWKEGLAVWKFALLAGFSFSGFSALTAIFVGPEFPTILGSLLALVLMVALAKRGVFVPKTAWKFNGETTAEEVSDSNSEMSFFRAISPYLIAISALVISRLDFLPIKNWLNHYQIGMDKIFGSEIGAFFAPLYSPGTIFTLVAILSIFILGVKKEQLRGVLRSTNRNILSSVISLGTSVPMVRIFLHSGVNALGLQSMPIALAANLASVFGPVWTLASPFLGMLGVFISGSGTISNLMFSLLQFGVAVNYQLAPDTVLALQTVGASIGKVICVVNVVAAASVVGLEGKEGKIIQYTFLPALFFCLLVALVALLLH